MGAAQSTRLSLPSPGHRSLLKEISENHLKYSFPFYNSLANIKGEYDIIALVHTIEHLPSEHLLMLQQMLKTNLKSEGIFYSVTNSAYPIETALFDMKEPTHHSFPTKESYQKWFPGGTINEFENRWDYSSTCIMTKGV